MIRSKGEAGTGNVIEAVRHMRRIAGGIRRLAGLRSDELFSAAKELAAPYDLVAEVAASGRLPVVLFTAGGIATPADAAMMMQLGADGVFVGSGIFKSGDPARRGQGDRRGDHLLPRPGDRGQGVARARRADGRHRRRARGRAAGRPRLVADGRTEVGVLAYQGDVREHLAALAAVGADPVEVRTLADLDTVAGLVVPGGESTVIGKLAARYGLLEPLRERVAAGLPVLGTCAGMIFLAREVEGPPQDLLGGLDVRVRRNAFGRQVASFEARWRSRGSTATRSRARSSAPPGWPTPAPRSRCWPRWTARWSRCARATCSPPPSTPS
jgi:putative intracellular protease/amidase